MEVYMKIITVASVKGGAGKSTTALSLATVLSRDSKILILDLDPQGSSSAHLIEETDSEYSFDNTIREVLLGEKELNDILIHPWVNVSFAPADLRLSSIDQDLSQENNAIFLLNDILENVKDDYDYVVIDTSPNTGLATRMALTAADFVVIPVQLEGWPVLALDLVFNLIEGAKKSQKYIGKTMDKVLVCPNFYVENLVVTKSFHYALRQGYTSYLSETVIHKATLISQVYSQKRAQLKEDSKPFQEYLNLLNELLEVQTVE